MKIEERKHKFCSQFMDFHKINIQKRCSYHIAVVFILGCLLFQLSAGDGDEMEKKTETGVPASKSAMIIDSVKALFSLPTSPGHWAFKAKNLYQYGRNYFDPKPNIDFRGGGDGGAEGAAEKVKEAVVKSLDDSKATVVGSAKSAAKIMDAAVDNTVKKLKKTLSGKGKDETDHETEL